MGFYVNIHQWDAIGYDVRGDGRDESPNKTLYNSIEMPTSKQSFVVFSTYNIPTTTMHLEPKRHSFFLGGV